MNKLEELKTLRDGQHRTLVANSIEELNEMFEKLPKFSGIEVFNVQASYGYFYLTVVKRNANKKVLKTVDKSK